MFANISSASADGFPMIIAIGIKFLVQQYDYGNKRETRILSFIFTQRRAFQSGP